MKCKSFIFTLVVLCSSFSLFAQKNIWSKADENRIELKQYMERPIVPEKYEVWQADFASLKAYLDKAPMEFTSAAPLSFELPIPSVGMVTFKTVESPVYAPALAAKYPTFKSFSAVGGARNEYKARFDYTSHGFNAIVSTPFGEVYIDPYATDQQTYYMSYFTADNLGKNKGIILPCGAVGDNDHDFSVEKPFNAATTREAAGNTVVIRKYRLAIAATGEFTSKNGGTQAGALNKIVTLVNRCTKKYNDELAIRFELIPTTDTVIFTNASTDPYKSGNVGKDILGVSTTVISARVGNANYDMGHTLTGNCSDVGGVANAGVVCTTGSKGQGMSCDAGGTADQFAITIMCHEMGHQFSASHTMSACGNGTDQSQVASSSAIEPGSGTTIMSYDGSCGTDNITGQYWHEVTDVYSVGSLEQIMDYSRKGAGDACPQKINTTNTEPMVTILSPAGVTIPILTPFELSASGADADNDNILYSWEQADPGMYVPLATKKTLFANTFRVFDPVTTPIRTFPRMSDILAGKSTKAELYPDTARTYTFRCTARDNNVNGGGTTWSEMRFKSTHTAGPFVITYPIVATDTLASSEYTIIKWNVANTDKALVNCKFVDILLSTDGGTTFSKVLIKNTPNDGEEGVIIPTGTTASQARIRINAVNNIFFAVSQKNVYIKPTTKVGYTVVASSEQYTVCLPDVAKVNIQSSAFGGYNNKIKLSVVDGLPQGATAKFSQDSIDANENCLLSVDMTNVKIQGVYNIKIRTIAGTDTLFRTVAFQTVYSNFNDLALTTPKDGETAISTLPSFKWTPSAVADSYDFQLASNPSFDAASLVASKTGLKVTDLVSPVTLQENTPYYWRIKASNSCRSGEYSTTNSFATLVQTCQVATKAEKITIAGNAKNTYESTATVLEKGKASDINITNIKGYHDDFGDLEIILENPTGKTATLFSKKCSSISADFNVSFDDESAVGFNCSTLNAASTFKPATPMSVFKNEEINGIWKLKVNDTKVGSGGQLLGWNLRFCFATSVIAPTIVKNDTLHVKKGGTRYVDNTTLSATDDKSPGWKIQYTLVSTPVNGYLDRWGTKMKVGDAFSQDELINGKAIRYFNSLQSTSNTDFFLFVITDGDGGFLGTLRYNVIRDENAPTLGTHNSTDVDNAVQIYPNPSQQSFNVVLSSEELGKTDLTLFNVQGQVINTQTVSNTSLSATFDVRELPNGVYYLKINTTKGFATKKVVVQH